MHVSTSISVPSHSLLGGACDSLLGGSCDSMENGPIYIDCSLDYPVSLKDANLDDVLTYQFKTMNLFMKNQSVDHSLRLLVHYCLYNKSLPLMINHRNALSPEEALSTV